MEPSATFKLQALGFVGTKEGEILIESKSRSLRVGKPTKTESAARDASGCNRELKRSLEARLAEPCTFRKKKLNEGIPATWTYSACGVADMAGGSIGPPQNRRGSKARRSRGRAESVKQDQNFQREPEVARCMSNSGRYDSPDI